MNVKKVPIMSIDDKEKDEIKKLANIAPNNKDDSIYKYINDLVNTAFQTGIKKGVIMANEESK